jgi:predicted aminopeptidase
MRLMVSNSRARMAFAVCTAAVLLVSLASCQTVGYYSQAVGGQMELWRAAEPIDEILEDENTDPALRERLGLVSEIRTFATEELGLPDGGSYRRYADLERPYVIWNVFAAPALSLDPVTWCFPIAGCVGYRGYFSEEGAQQFADGMRERGFDVYVGGVPAYSTLGWFDDAVLNTFIGYSDADLAQLIFHELAHQVAYAPGDTTTRAELEVIYQSEETDEVKLSQKVDAYSRLRDGYQALREEWGGYSGYDLWFEGPLNNAQIGSVAAYNQLVPAFQQLLADKGGDMSAFYQAVTELTELSVEERRARLGVNEIPCSDCAAGTPDAGS